MSYAQPNADYFPDRSVDAYLQTAPVVRCAVRHSETLDQPPRAALRTRAALHVFNCKCIGIVNFNHREAENLLIPALHSLFPAVSKPRSNSW